MPSVKISVFDEKNQQSKLVETRFIDVESNRRLNAASATRILKREFPEVRVVSGMLKSDQGFIHMETLKPTEKCDYHYVWRKIVIAEA